MRICDIFEGPSSSAALPGAPPSSAPPPRLGLAAALALLLSASSNWIAKSALVAVRPLLGCVCTKWPLSGRPPISLTRLRSSIAIHAPICRRVHAHQRVTSVIDCQSPSHAHPRANPVPPAAACLLVSTIGVEPIEDLHRPDRRVHAALRRRSNHLHVAPLASHDDLSLQLCLRQRKSPQQFSC